jgi:AcrR family transcriptional regulator
MDAIAEAAGVTKPVVYECYPSKPELFRALLEREEERMLAAVAEAMPAANGPSDIEGLLEGGFRGLLGAAGEAPDSWRVIFDSAGRSEPVVAARIERSRAVIVEQLGAVIDALLTARGVPDVERVAPVYAELLTSMAEAGVRLLLRSEGAWTPEGLSRLLAGAAARGALGGEPAAAT